MLSKNNLYRNTLVYKGTLVKWLPKLVITAVALAVLYLVSSTVFASDLAQLWGQRNAESQGYGGQTAYMTTMNPNIAAGNWAAGPNGTTWLVSPPFVESGPTKACDIDCGLHPYAAWGTASGVLDQFVDTSRFLAAGGWYQYKNWFTGNNEWEAQFCDGLGCHVLVRPNLGSSASMPYVSSGGESNHMSTAIGSATTAWHQYILGGTTSFFDWCYTAVTNNTTSGTISACAPSDFSWAFAYTP